MGTYKYIDLDGYARISEHISAHNGTYLARSGTYLERTMARIWRGIGYVDCSPVPIRIIRFHRSIQLYYRFALCYCIRYLRLHAGFYVSFTASAAARFGTTAGNAPRLSNSFGDAAAPCVDSAGRVGASDCFGGSATVGTAAARPPSRRRHSVDESTTTGLESRRQALPAAGDGRHPAAPAQAECVSIG